MTPGDVKEWVDVIRSDQAALILAVWAILEAKRFFSNLAEHLRRVEEKLDNLTALLAHRAAER